MLLGLGAICLAAGALFLWQDRERPEVVLVSPADGVCGGVVPPGKPVPIFVEIENPTPDRIRIVGWSGC